MRKISLEACESHLSKEEVWDDLPTSPFSWPSSRHEAHGDQPQHSVWPGELPRIQQFSVAWMDWISLVNFLGHHIRDPRLLAVYYTFASLHCFEAIRGREWREPSVVEPPPLPSLAQQGDIGLWQLQSFSGTSCDATHFWTNPLAHFAL